MLHALKCSFEGLQCTLTCQNILQLVVAFGVPYTDDYYKKWGYILPIIFSLLPWCPFAKAIGDLGRASSSGNDGMSWSERDDCVLIGEVWFHVPHGI